MEGVIVSFRRSLKKTSANQMIVQFKGADSKEKAVSLTGKPVVWESPAKKAISGRVSAPHGSKGAVRVIFETGMPGQSLGTKVKIADKRE